MDTAHGFEREAIWSNSVMKKDHDQRLVCLINADFLNHAFVEHEEVKSSFYLLFSGVCDGLAAAGEHLKHRRERTPP